MQLNLFTPPPMPAVAIQPNAHGVYPDEAAEFFILPYERKGWLGVPLARIRLLHLPGGWLQSAEAMTPSGSGFGYGLCERHSGGFHDGREAALEIAVHRVERFAQRHDDAAGRKILAWARSLSGHAITDRRIAA